MGPANQPRRGVHDGRVGSDHLWPRTNSRPAEIDPSQQELLWWEQPLSLGPDVNIWVAAGGRSWDEIGNRVLRSAGVDDATPEDIRSTYLEIVNQSLSGVASAVSARVRKEISCVQGRAAPPPALPGAGVYTLPDHARRAGFSIAGRLCRLPSRILPMTRSIPRLKPLPRPGREPRGKSGIQRLH